LHNTWLSLFYAALFYGGAALVFCNAFMYTQQYFVFSNIAIEKQRFFAKCGAERVLRLAALWLTI
jgi:hypothetical protein